MFCCYGATGTLTIAGQALNGPAWDVPNLTALWIEAAVRGENRALAGVTVGQRGNPQRLDVAEFDLAFALTGDCNPAGVANANAWLGLQANLDTLYTAVFAPVTTGRGTRTATLTMPSGATRTATVQVDPLTFPNDIDDPSFVEAVIHLTVLSARFA